MQCLVFLLTMASELKNLSTYDTTKIPTAQKMKFGVVVSEWNGEITFALLQGAIQTLRDNGCTDDNIIVDYVPGTFELPHGAQLVAEAHTVDAVLCIGCVIKGETKHDEYINNSVSQALQVLSIQYKKPFVFGVLTPNTLEQAKDRAGGKHGNKGVETAITAIKMVDLRNRLKLKNQKIGF